MKSFDVYSRYGTKYKAVLVDDNTINFYPTKSRYVRAGNSSNVEDIFNSINYIDPEGGPFIGLYESPALCLHKDLPDREIILIRHTDDHYVLTLKEAKEKDTRPKRKPKIKEQKILKHTMHIRN